MRYGTVEAVRPRRAGRAARRVRRAEHEVIDDQLRAPVKELSQRLWPLGGVEPVVLLDRYPGQRAPRGRELVAAARQLLFPREQFVAGRLPLLAGCDFVIGARNPFSLPYGLGLPRGCRGPAGRSARVGCGPSTGQIPAGCESGPP